MNAVDFSISPRRTLLQTSHDELTAQYRQWQNQVVVARYGTAAADEYRYVPELALCDLSTLDRCGFKGRGAPAWLQDQGAAIPDAPNRARWHPRSGLFVRLSSEEHLLLRNPFEETLRSPLFDVSTVEGARVYALPRQDSHAWLYLCGRRAAHMMSFICAVDLRPERFAPLNVAQTSVAKLSGIVVRQDLGSIPGFHLLCDQPSVAYWWEVLLDAADPLDGRPVGIDALLAHHVP